MHLTRLLILICLCFTSCSSVSTKRDLRDLEALLEEGNAQINMRQFGKAEEVGEEALKLASRLAKASPDDVTVQLLWIQADMQLFMAKNVMTFENAPIEEKSLVRMPKLAALIDYEKHLQPAEERLKSLINEKVPLTARQLGFVRGSLAAIFRLSKKTAPEAVGQYRLAIEAYEALLAEKKKKWPRQQSKRVDIHQIEDKVRSLKMSEAEVLLLIHDFGKALTTLQNAMAGEDLKFFSTQFDVMEERLISLRARILEGETYGQNPRSKKLRDTLNRMKKERMTHREWVAEANPYRLDLVKTQTNLAETQNNLLYRIICYKQLGQNEKLEEARKILRAYYPEIDSELETFLQKYS